MLRRSWLLLTLALGLLAAPLPAEAQKAGKVARIGILCTGWCLSVYVIEPFLKAMRDFGYVEGKNISIQPRDAQGRLDQLPGLAAELVALKVDAILGVGGEAAVLAAKNATRTIPIVMLGPADPVGRGFVTSIARPGGNITGLALFDLDLYAKQLQLLKQAAPAVSRVAILWAPANPGHGPAVKRLKAVGPSLGVRIHLLAVRDPDEIEGVFSVMSREGTDAVLVLAVSDAPVLRDLPRLKRFALENRLPTISSDPEFANFGGLMTYRPSPEHVYQRAAFFVDKILRGAQPADLPVEQPTRFELVLNLLVAKALGLTIPDSVLIQADKIIE